jgi:hypothetical protein
MPAILVYGQGARPDDQSKRRRDATGAPAKRVETADSTPPGSGRVSLSIKKVASN